MTDAPRRLARAVKPAKIHGPVRYGVVQSVDAVDGTVVVRPSTAAATDGSEDVVARMLEGGWPRVGDLARLDVYQGDVIVIGIVGNPRPPRAAVYQTGSQSIPNDTLTAISWGDVHYDTDAFWDSGSATRLTVPMPGVYHVDVVVAYGINTTGYREVELRRTGTAVRGRARATPVGVSSTVNVSVDLDLADGDYLEVWTRQNSGGALGTVSGLTWTNANIRLVSL